MILLIDNYDSFVYNLARYLEELSRAVTVVRSDLATVEDVRRMRPEAVVLSPGPCDPASAGVCIPLVRRLSGVTPILGVCLGHQAIAAAFGARVVRSGRPRHGVASRVFHDGVGIFEGLPSPFPAARYHSLVVDPESLPDELEVSAHTEDGQTILALRHRAHPTVGVQFHPESILTDGGHRLLDNFLRLAARSAPAPTAVEHATSR